MSRPGLLAAAATAVLLLNVGRRGMTSAAYHGDTSTDVRGRNGTTQSPMMMDGVDEPSSSSSELPVNSKQAVERFETMLAALRAGNMSRIVGGESAKISEFPHQVAWIYNDVLRCGASVLSREWLISAAHCFPPRMETRGSAFRAGSSYAAKGGQLVRAVSFHRHPKWRLATMDWDLGLIKVEPALNLDGTVRAIKIVNADVKLTTRTRLVVTGWGLLEEKGQSNEYGGSYQLQKVGITVVNHKRCSKAYKVVHMSVTDHMLCAQGPHKDACQGDSGGPLVLQGDGSHGLLGLVSWGVGCAREQFPGVYTDLRHPGHREFIESVTGLSLG